MDDYCDQHIETVKKLATIEQKLDDFKASFEDVKSRMVSHINEGERTGGIRERVGKTEAMCENLQLQISLIKKGYWFAALVGGLIGGLVAINTPESFKFISKMIFGIR